MFLEVITTAVLDKAWKDRSRIWQFAQDLAKAASKGRFRLYAFGPGGVGKSTLANLLSGKYSLETVPPKYNLSLTLEDSELEGRNFVTVYVPPGQEDKRAYHWDRLYREMIDARRYAVINVVAWGYHSIANIELNRHRLYRKDMDNDEFMNSFLQDRRDAEIRVLQEILPHLKAAPNNVRMLTLVTKQDLWWDQRAAVKQYYETGPYNSLIEELKSHKGKASFSHDYLSASLTLLNFKDVNGKILRTTEGGYDLSLWIANFENVLKYIKELIE